MDVPAIAKVAFTSENRVRDVIRNFNADGFGSLYPKYRGGHPPKFTLGQRREIKKIAKSKPAEHDLPFSTWSLAKLADFLVAEGVVDDISHEGLRVLLRAEGVTFQRLKTWKEDPRYAEKKARVEQLYAVADREITPADGDPEVVFCVDEFGPLNLQPHPGGSGPRSAARTKNPAGRRGPGCAPPTPAPPGSGTCSPPTSLARTSSTGTSSRARPGPGSWNSAATCALCIPHQSGSRSSATTSAPTSARTRTAGSAPGPRRTMSRSPTRRRIRPG